MKAIDARLRRLKSEVLAGLQRDDPDLSAGPHCCANYESS
jgi:hypothetical protein